jgi:hypothetical protein
VEHELLEAATVQHSNCDGRRWPGVDGKEKRKKRIR